MRIVIDKDIPFITGVFEPFAEVSYIKGGEISSGDVKEADAMIIRTRTKCVPALLEGSSIKLIATATIGCDHIDMDYCERKGIKVVNAAGCNSGGVLQYVFTALFAVAYGRSLPLYYGTAPGRKSVIGIIGVGHVGSRVADFAEYLGFKVLRNDPLKEREQTLAFNAGKLKLEDFKTYYSLEYLLANSDIVTIHVPLTSKTRGMVDEGFMSGLKDGAILINTSRGE
ncbi:MAG: NAD(P)-binding domain-containing protein, partial [Bacteroidales bacterium]|nr:NAD(P)-binding domain-containing protein [Bacteroidales bacterium]